jgi:hypothetical protein
MTKHQHIGLVEIKNIDGKLLLFLLDIDVISKKVFATYGPFEEYIEVVDHAAFIGLQIK